MNIITKKNIVLENSETKPFLADFFYPDCEGKFPLLIFVHGYKGFKDWGAWNLMAEKFAKAGFFFVKFNFSHNGTSLENPTEFTDLESFGQNNYSKELSDLGFAIEYFLKHPKTDASQITLIGHSRGGGISAVKTFEDERIQSLITLASVDSLNRFPKNEDFENWKKTGVYYSPNGRTGQQMPHYFQFYEDYLQNEKRLNVEFSMKHIKAKTLIIHGTGDESVPDENSRNLHLWKPESELFLIENANHTFGAKEPWTEFSLPKDLETAVEKMIDFLK
ncbi:MAG: alpha/beta fold hydrolase [Flavobacteriaceae bacterium]|jgi:dienelactone hydrolase|nr:alpha/beta fold hydrolase [Flavobacteriaceae bacterium]